MKSITITRRLPSHNAFNNKRGIGAQFSYSKERDVWLMLLRAQLVPRATSPTGKVSIRIISYRNRLLDYANLVGGCKAIPDCLKKLGHIKDDSPKWFACDYQQRQVPLHEEMTVIEFLGEVKA